MVKDVSKSDMAPETPVITGGDLPAGTQVPPSASETKALICGPLLRFRDVNATTSTWTGSVMIVIQEQVEPAHLQLFLPEKTSPVSVKPLMIFQYKSNKFIRYDLQVPQHESQDSKVEYVLNVAGNELRNTFHVPAASHSWRYMFFSCNGFCNEVDRKAYHDVQPMWADVLRYHEKEPYHAMLGGGDQVYSDNIFEAPSVKKWLDLDGNIHLSCVSFFLLFCRTCTKARQMDR